MDKIINEVSTVVMNWQEIAKGIGISRAEQELMAGAFLI